MLALEAPVLIVLVQPGSKLPGVIVLAVSSASGRAARAEAPSMNASVAYAAAAGSALTTSRICHTSVCNVCRLYKSSAEKKSHAVVGSGNGEQRLEQRRVQLEVTQLLGGELMRRRVEDVAARWHVRDEAAEESGEVGLTFLRVCHTCACGCAYARVFAYAGVTVRDAGSSSIVAGRVCRKFDATRVASRCVIQIDIDTGTNRSLNRH